MVLVVFLLFLSLVCPVWAVSNAVADLEIINPPLNGSSFNGNLLRNDTEFLTPSGILDNLPPQASLPDLTPLPVDDSSPTTP